MRLQKRDAGLQDDCSRVKSHYHCLVEITEDNNHKVGAWHIDR